ncbi:hypothetical protein ESCO_004977 [Escovopsis weberi]|uniref:Uncharacterized protein n=1 Tax=Escovopsis weberi TaxID=150374 RepID=A0A0M9VW14_ESCWE|nr:hypothetical protein ESCO_004977 [Escovopsis weberi]
MQIASTSHFIYSHGAVCYTADKHYIRVLHLRDPLLRGPVSQELVIDVRRLLAFTVFPIIGFQESSEYTELFVRNSESYLYFGTKSEPRDDYRKRWILQGLDLERGQWLPSRLILRDFVGTEIGSAICFEIFDDYLYCLSNQQMLEPGETARNSFYYALRFRLGDAQTNLEVKSLQKAVVWRRRADEGPVDERWNTLELSKDEKTGKVFIIETRKEFFSAVSQSLRTCYKMELVFPTSAPHLAPRNMAYLQNLLSKNRDTEIKFWPDPSLSGSDSLYEIMNPEDGFDKADSAMDERSLVYCLRSYDSECKESPLILVSFDPALHLLGLPRFYSPISHCCDSQTLAASTKGESSTATSYYSLSDQTSSNDLCSDSEYAALAASPTPPPSSCWITKRIATYITRVKDGAVRGFDLSREPCRSPSH